MSELSLWLDNYDDIYSDFDSRQFLKRRISEDFVHELRMAKKYKKENATDLLLFLPQDKRDENSENVIINSLKGFFTEQLHTIDDRYRKKLRSGISLLLAGFMVMLINSQINFEGRHSLILSIVKVLLEPGGWFLLWLGFDFLLYPLREIKKEREFFREFSEINIHFRAS